MNNYLCRLGSVVLFLIPLFGCDLAVLLQSEDEAGHYLKTVARVAAEAAVPEQPASEPISVLILRWDDSIDISVMLGKPKTSFYSDDVLQKVLSSVLTALVESDKNQTAMKAALKHRREFKLLVYADIPGTHQAWIESEKDKWVSENPLDRGKFTVTTVYEKTYGTYPNSRWLSVKLEGFDVSRFLRKEITADAFRPVMRCNPKESCPKE